MRISDWSSDVCSSDLVLRRKPPGQLLKGAHAVEREAQVLIGLGKAGFPVAHVFGLCADDGVIGTAFYVMEMVEGRIFWDATLPEIAHGDRPAYFDAMNATIAQLHGIDYQAVGLGDYGRPGNYFERQIARWSKQYLEDIEAGRDPNMDQLIEWLPANIPPGDETTIVHGDFRIDNMIFHTTEPRVLAVLDRSEEHTSELQSLMRISYAVFCLKKNKHIIAIHDMHLVCVHSYQ